MKTEEELKKMSSKQIKDLLDRNYKEIRKFAAIFLDLSAKQYDGIIFRAEVCNILNSKVEIYADTEQEIFLMEKILDERAKNKKIDENNLS